MSHPVESADESICQFDDKQMVQDLADQIRAKLEIRDRRYHLTTYTKCFLGSDAVKWLMGNGHAETVEDALLVGQLMMDQGMFAHVTRDHSLKDESLFYRFALDEPSKGEKAVSRDGKALTWAQFLNGILPVDVRPLDGSKQTDLKVVSRDPNMQMAPKHIGVAPLDAYNTSLLDHVHPAAWHDPLPKATYNLVVMGAGTGGLVSAAGAAGVQAKVALIEDHLMGGDCLNVGCVPSKALIKAATVAHHAREAYTKEYGVHIDGSVRVDLGEVMQRMRRLRASISHHDSAERFTKDLGVDVYIGKGVFTSPNTITVNGKTLSFRKAVIATGGNAAVPPIPGLADSPYLTNASLFNLTDLPKRIIVMGAGPIGLEMAQSFRRFGSEVVVLNRGGKVLPKEDADAAAVVQKALERDGLVIKNRVTFVKVTHEPPAEGQPFGKITVHIERDGGSEVIEGEALLVATGRKPNVRGIGLEAAGVEYDDRMGVKVNDYLQTSNKSIYAVGDCCTKFHFTHAADFMARAVIRNALFWGKAKMSDLLIPWCTVTEPEIAHVGLYPRDMESGGIAYRTFTKPFAAVDRAILEGDTEGFVKIHTKQGSDEILGATIVGPNAGDMISEISVAMESKMGLGALASVIHPYPTKAEAVRQCGDLYNKTRLTVFVKGVFRKLMQLQR
ncbi:unnamed protein product [Vitrella brassicaformis CCMP3155]|uniref:DEP domain-containing protein n=1 Tax=Vitrella brassicaformis (strain CCMP3155) TaxID=1169540 RepID=A0A0G4FLL1_VITBC|nr:unnamed protein product [Vitrella brassicaformis CCMP3155]|eukprot:CEM14661.1 unnamed protein product [Vitrella brassicaformis CCMP3155]